MFGVVWPCLQEDHFFVRKAWRVARKHNQFGCGGLASDLKVKVLYADGVAGGFAMGRNCNYEFIRIVISDSQSL